MPTNDRSDTDVHEGVEPAFGDYDAAIPVLEAIPDRDTETITFTPRDTLDAGHTTTAWVTVDADTVVDLTTTL